MTCSSPAAADVLKDGEPAIVNAAKDAAEHEEARRRREAQGRARRSGRRHCRRQRIGVQGTPYFLINNLVARGALSSDLFKEAINMALQAAPSGQK